VPQEGQPSLSPFRAQLGRNITQESAHIIPYTPSVQSLLRADRIFCRPEGLLQTLKRRQALLRRKAGEEEMGGKSPRARFGVDIEAVDNDGKTALHRAAMFSDTDKVRQVHNISK